MAKTWTEVEQLRVENWQLREENERLRAEVRVAETEIENERTECLKLGCEGFVRMGRDENVLTMSMSLDPSFWWSRNRDAAIESWINSTARGLVERAFERQRKTELDEIEERTPRMGERCEPSEAVILRSADGLERRAVIKVHRDRLFMPIWRDVSPFVGRGSGNIGAPSEREYRHEGRIEVGVRVFNEVLAE